MDQVATLMVPLVRRVTRKYRGKKSKPKIKGHRMKLIMLPMFLMLAVGTFPIRMLLSVSLASLP